MTKKLPPVHPGEVLLEEFVKGREFSFEIVQRLSELSPDELSQLLDEAATAGQAAATYNDDKLGVLLDKLVADA